MSNAPLYGTGAWWRLPDSGSTSTRCKPALEGFRSAYADAIGFQSTHARSVNGARSAGARLYGHAAVTGPWARIESRAEGRFLERIAPGAFTETIQRDRGRMKCLFQHGRDSQIADKPIGNIEVIREDDAGLYYEVGLFDGIPPLLLNGLRAGVYGASFRFKVDRQRIVDRPGRSDWNPAGLPERTIHAASVKELGPVTWGAYREASANVAMPAPQLAAASAGRRSAVRLRPRQRRPGSWVIR